MIFYIKTKTNKIMPIEYAKDDNFDEVMTDVKKALIVFSATWCGPCKMLTPVIEELADSRKDMKIIKLDVDESPNVAGFYEVLSIPTMIILQASENNNTKGEDANLTNKAFNNFIKSSVKTGFLEGKDIEDWYDGC